ncbi:MAG: LCP family protein [Candidatus Margulisbacteria bacterium]|nr:LCP family protein [Candidatus Margulisiibacteriota bacterium]
MKKTFTITVIIILLFTVLFGFFVGIATRLALFDIFISLTPTKSLLEKTNILVLGVDHAFGSRSDTIMVLHIDPEAKKAALISIPRDTLVVLPGRGLDKVNHAFAYGGVELSKSTVEQFLGIEIPYYVVINLSGIIKIIDDLGGITVNVEHRMYYVDYAGDLNIDLQPGVQKLNGRQAMGYLRYRRDGGDFKRISRQQDFLAALSKEMMKRENILRSPQLFLTFLSYIYTNMDSRQILGLSLAVRSAQETGQIKMTTVPGSDMMVNGAYYLKPNTERLQEIVQQYFLEGKKDQNP